MKTEREREYDNQFQVCSVVYQRNDETVKYDNPPFFLPLFPFSTNFNTLKEREREGEKERGRFASIAKLCLGSNQLSLT